MKPAQFQYTAPRSLDEALALLAQHGDEATVLAGGQSLVPLLNFRLARPAVVVDINRVAGLDGLTVNGGVTAGATVRQRTLERNAAIAAANPLLAEAMPLIGHFQIRNRGTVCGSLVHADPAAELPAVAVACDAELTLSSVRGERIVPAAEFFISVLTTAREPDELLTQVRFPAWRPGDGWAVLEVARRHGDFALAGVVARVRIEAERITGSRVVLFGVSDRPYDLADASAALRGRVPDAATLEDLASSVRQEIDPDGDIHATAEYRRRVAGTLAARAVATAAARAGG